MNTPQTLDFQTLRDQIVGADAPFQTPFGERLMVYADYTASGRCLGFVETYLQSLQRIYANTHTEDDITGRSMTQLLEQAEQSIKNSVNAGPDGRIICCGTGATGAIDKLQQIIGVAFPPATREALSKMLVAHLGDSQPEAFEEYLARHQPVVFVGPYEHHSNEISWRQGLATTVEVELDEDGSISLEHLEQLLRDPAYQDRVRIGSFSAASNVTGMRSDVYAIATLLHRYDAMACFDYAACAPYVRIDMNPDPEDITGNRDDDPSLDAIFISPHKFIGGPGSSGVLVFNNRIYNRHLPPSVSAGGTVDYVGPTCEDFIESIEEREKAGTPGVLQIMKAALAFQIKDRVTPEKIEQREADMLHDTFQRWQDNPAIEILGNPDPERRIGIVSFNIRDPKGSYLHPKFLTSLLNDLFGIQSRAGCSCAGPYGHRLLNIGNDVSEKYRDWIRRGYTGIKPGWCRVSFHYTMDDAEYRYIVDAIEFIAAHGFHFLPLYNFDMASGAWQHKQQAVEMEGLSLDAAMTNTGTTPAPLALEQRQLKYAEFLADAHRLADSLAQQPATAQSKFDAELAELQFFSVPESCCITSCEPEG
jgi:selenocysteine lyase/cysteine desulfurase